VLLFRQGADEEFWWRVSSLGFEEKLWVGGWSVRF